MKILVLSASDILFLETVLSSLDFLGGRTLQFIFVCVCMYRKLYIFQLQQICESADEVTC